jgi:hypothetical protein
VPLPSHSSRFYHPNNIGWGIQIRPHEVYCSPEVGGIMLPRKAVTCRCTLQECWGSLSWKPRLVYSRPSFTIFLLLLKHLLWYRRVYILFSWVVVT